RAIATGPRGAQKTEPPDRRVKGSPRKSFVNRRGAPGGAPRSVNVWSGPPTYTSARPVTFLVVNLAAAVSWIAVRCNRLHSLGSSLQRALPPPYVALKLKMVKSRTARSSIRLRRRAVRGFAPREAGKN